MLHTFDFETVRDRIFNDRIDALDREDVWVILDNLKDDEEYLGALVKALNERSATRAYAVLDAAKENYVMEHANDDARKEMYRQENELIEKRMKQL